MIEPRTFGRFFIDAIVIDHGWESLVGVFADLVVLDCRYRPELNKYEYVALSSAFRPVALGCECFTYEAVMVFRPEEGGVPGAWVFKGWR